MRARIPDGIRAFCYTPYHFYTYGHGNNVTKLGRTLVMKSGKGLYCTFMLTLYVRTGCPYCAKVLAAGQELGISFDLKNIADEGIADELIAKGGKRQTPYLVDSERGVAMYESDAIVNYLR